MPEHGEYFLRLRSDFIPLASIAPPKGALTTTLFVYYERAEAAGLLRELGADPAHVEAIPEAEFLTARERERVPGGGLRFCAERARPC